jgi:GWxTD domain-containing protein
MNRLHRTAILGILLWSWVFAPLWSGRFDQEKSSPSKIQEFLNLTAYLILPQENNVLLKLTTDRERDIFVESFWKQRDPTPGTPQNEYKDEVIKRFQYANKFFGRGTTREGWRTDRGRIHMILGEPASKQDFSGRRGVYPCEVWYYYGNKDKGMPAHFGLVFFKRKGVGEPRLYDPASDGIQSLLMNTDGLSFDSYPSLYQQLRELVPELAQVALSIIPGEIPYGYAPSSQESILLADILESPKKDVNPNYATHFLDYKGMVSTEYMTNYVDHAACVDIVRDPQTGLTFLNFSIAPKTIRFDYYQPKDQQFCNLQLNVSLRRGETVVFQYAKDFPVYFSSEEAGRIKANGISVEDSFPVMDGRYRLILLLQNTAGKEFTIYEQDVEVPALEGGPRLTGPTVGYELKDVGQAAHLPYQVQGKKLMIDPSRTISLQDALSFFYSLSDVPESVWKEGRVAVTISGSRTGPSAFKTLTIPLNSQPFARILSYLQSVPAGELPPDYYILAAALQDASGRTLDEQKATFVVSPSADVPHPLAQVKMGRMANPAPFYLMLADQSDKTDRRETAEAWYERAFAANPGSRTGLIEYARFLLKVGKPEKGASLIESIKDDPALRFDYLLTKGLAAMAMGRTADAVDVFLEGNKIYDSDTLLLNSLGACYSRLGQKEKALAALRASLRLNPEQADIRKLIAEIEKTPPPEPSPPAKP